MASSWPLLEEARANNALRPQRGQGARAGGEVAEEEPVILKLGVYEAAAGVDAVGGCDCRGKREGAAAAGDYSGGGSGAAATGEGGGETEGVTLTRLLALPEAILSEVLGELRATCWCCLCANLCCIRASPPTPDFATCCFVQSWILQA